MEIAPFGAGQKFKCPNHGGKPQAAIATVSDGTYLRPVLECGCTPTHEEVNHPPVSAELPPPPPPPAVELADAEAGGRTHLEIMVEQILRAKGLFE